jgi:glutamyl-tRNA reductase
MTILVVGISHRSAPIALLERLAVDTDGATKLTEDVLANPHVSEATVVATCNRLEIYAAVDRFHGSVEGLSQRLLEPAHQGVEPLLPNLYIHYDDGAVSHLFRVAAGLDSMAVGEAQILGQTRDALQLGQELGSVGPVLNTLFQQALRVGKRAHAETGIDRAAPTLVSAALDRAVDDVLGRRVVVVGAGAMAALAVSTVVRRGAGEVVVVNRTPERAERLAGEYAVRWAPLAALDAEVAAADLVVACAGAAGVLLGRDAVAAAPGPLALVDLALPHDIDPTVADLPGVTLVTLADLADDLRESAAGAEVDAVRTIVTDEVAAFLSARRQSGHRRGGVRDGPARAPHPRPGRRHPGRGAADAAPGHRQAGAPADDPGQGTGQPQRRLLRHGPGRAVRPGPRGGRRGHPRRRVAGRGPEPG